MQDFRDLKVWSKGHQLTLAVYRATVSFPSDERFALTSQIRRASSSIPANIAEGCGRGSSNEMRRYLQMAMGSACELEYHLLLAHELGYLQESAYRPLHEAVCEVKRMLAGFITKLRN